ncbi:MULTISPECIES: hypothetical protein [unclassified Streptomyces]|uniref:hypothetical protein n=1 Tax=unclassified Streptomyces TaxID=2593676 RepID=UPI0038063651
MITVSNDELVTTAQAMLNPRSEGDRLSGDVGCVHRHRTGNRILCGARGRRSRGHRP